MTAEARPGDVLDWGLVIATKDRIKALQVCIGLALSQTRPPAEVIVVDASAEWQDHRDRIGRLLADHPGVRFHYLQAALPSLTVQRNQGIAQAQAAVLFLLDDDSFMYPDCAERIMAIYEADAEGRIGGIQTGVAALPPPAATDAGAQKKRGSKTIGAGQGKARGRVGRWLLQRVLLLDKAALFIPYDKLRPLPPLPPVLAGQEVSAVRLFQGYRMTFRRQVVLEEPFDEMLRYYCPGEDIDASYRISRRYLLLTAPAARLHHFTSAGGRIDRLRTTTLSALNQAVLLRRHAADQTGARRRYFALMRRRLLAEVLKDALSRRFDLPQARGILQAHARARRIFGMTSKELADWYPAEQARLLRG